LAQIGNTRAVRPEQAAEIIQLGKLNEGGALVHARSRTWGPLIFQDLFNELVIDKNWSGGNFFEQAVSGRPPPTVRLKL
jgi:hypothetical protein